MYKQALEVNIKPWHHVNVKTSDGKCSRCRRIIRDDEIPLHLWLPDPTRMLVYCDACSEKIIDGKP